MSKHKETEMFARKLTDREIQMFRGENSVDCCIANVQGWWYGDSQPSEEDPSGLSEASFISDEGGNYIPFPHHPAQLRCSPNQDIYSRIDEEYGKDHYKHGIYCSGSWRAKPRKSGDVLIATVRVRAHDPLFNVYQRAP